MKGQKVIANPHSKRSSDAPFHLLGGSIAISTERTSTSTRVECFLGFRPIASTVNDSIREFFMDFSLPLPFVCKIHCERVNGKHIKVNVAHTYTHTCPGISHFNGVRTEKKWQQYSRYAASEAEQQRKKCAQSERTEQKESPCKLSENASILICTQCYDLRAA